MIRTVPQRWFYEIVRACCFRTCKSFNLKFAFSFLGISHPLKSSTILSIVTNIDFFVLFSHWLVIFVFICCECFSGLQPLSNDLAVMFFLLLILFLVIVYTAWNVYILVFLPLDGFGILQLLGINLIYGSFQCCCLLPKNIFIAGKKFYEGIYNS